jgi:hypothetical protein
MKLLDIWIAGMLPAGGLALFIHPALGATILGTALLIPIMATVLAEPETHYRDQHLAEVAARKAHQNETHA